MEVEEVPEIEGVDALYDLDPGEFVAARDRLARQLRAEGKRDAAAAVKRLRRPTVVAWSLNQVVRSQPGLVDDLYDATSAVERAQAEALDGGDGSGLRQAGHRRRQLISRLARAATERAGAGHHDEVVATLDAATLDPAAGLLLRQGHLSRELQPQGGFGIAAEPGEAERSGSAYSSGLSDSSVAAPPSAASQPEVDLEPLRRRVARAEDEVVRAGHKLARAGGGVAQAEEEVAQAEEEMRQTEEAVRQARAGLRRARDRMDAAGKDHQRALDEHNGAKDALAEGSGVTASG